jgi:predicted nucleotidyltransferase
MNITPRQGDSVILLVICLLNFLERIITMGAWAMRNRPILSRTRTMLTHERIIDAVAKTATRFPLKKVSYFGSYADGVVTEQSDLDILVEFTQPNVWLWTITGLKYDLENELSIPVDVIHAPLPQGTLIKIGKTIPVYDGKSIMDF